MRRQVQLAAALLFIGLGLAIIAPSRINAHQPAPGPSCISDVKVEPLGSGPPATADGQEIKLLRVTFAPGGSIGLHTHPGALTLSIQSGELTYAMHDGEVEVRRAAVDGTPVPTEHVAQGHEAVLETGDWLFEQGSMHTARNAGDVPAVVLIAGLMKAGEPSTQCVEEAS